MNTRFNKHSKAGDPAERRLQQARALWLAATFYNGAVVVLWLMIAGLSVKIASVVCFIAVMAPLYIVPRLKVTKDSFK